MKHIPCAIVKKFSNLEIVIGSITANDALVLVNTKKTSVERGMFGSEPRGIKVFFKFESKTDSIPHIVRQ